jgi:DNA/RNA-binding domain of Phe-tRNA-synthetase-like protein
VNGLQSDPSIASIVSVHAAVVDGLDASAHAPRLTDALMAAEAAARSATENAPVIEAVRAMYRRLGVDPTKTRPSSEALLRRVRKGDPLPRVNTLVDIINWSSLESQLPFGLYDHSRVRFPVEARLGRDGEEYAGIRKDVVHLRGRLVLSDTVGPFGNPTSDSSRTMVTPQTTSVLVVVFAPAALGRDAGEGALRLAGDRLRAYGQNMADAPGRDIVAG